MRNTAAGDNGISTSWYEGNIETCASKGMRLPTLYETSVADSNPYFHPTDASPTFNAANGIPSGADFTWTASSSIDDANAYWSCSGSFTDVSTYCDARTAYVRCVLP